MGGENCNSLWEATPIKPFFGYLLMWHPKEFWESWTGMRSCPNGHPNTKTRSTSYTGVTHTWQAAGTLSYNVDKALVLNTDQYLASGVPGIESWHLSPPAHCGNQAHWGTREGQSAELLAPFCFSDPELEELAKSR